MSAVARVLADMVRAIDDVERYARAGRAAYDADELVRAWVEYRLILLGEAARRVGEQHPGYHAAHPGGTLRCRGRG